MNICDGDDICVLVWLVNNVTQEVHGGFILDIYVIEYKDPISILVRSHFRSPEVKSLTSLNMTSLISYLGSWGREMGQGGGCGQY